MCWKFVIYVSKFFAYYKTETYFYVQLHIYINLGRYITYSVGNRHWYLYIPVFLAKKSSILERHKFLVTRPGKAAAAEGKTLSYKSHAPQ